MFTLRASETGRPAARTIIVGVSGFSGANPADAADTTPGIDRTRSSRRWRYASNCSPRYRPSIGVTSVLMV